MQKGVIVTSAGTGRYAFTGDNGPASTASFQNPFSILMDKDENLFIADAWNHRIRYPRFHSLTRDPGRNTAQSICGARRESAW